MNLLGMLMGTLGSGSSVNALSQKTGLSAAKISKLVMAALPVLLKFLKKNVSSADGALSLLTALGGHKETRSMVDQINEADEEDGLKIVNHILGDEKEAVLGNLAKESELESADVSKVLSNFAPALMSGLSAATTSASKVDLSDGLDLSDVMGMFGGEAPAQSGGGLLGGLLGGGGGIGGIISGLFGGKDKKDDDDDSNDLLGMLTSMMK